MGWLRRSPKIIPAAQITPWDIDDVKRRLPERINEDRLDHRLAPVHWEELASEVGDRHCREMLLNGYMAHWNLQGYKPYHRYSFAGGTNSVHENCSRMDSTADSIVTLDDVLSMALRCHESMMSERPPDDGHRRNILTLCTLMSVSAWITAIVGSA